MFRSGPDPYSWDSGLANYALGHATHRIRGNYDVTNARLGYGIITA